MDTDDSLLQSFDDEHLNAHRNITQTLQSTLGFRYLCTLTSYCANLKSTTIHCMYSTHTNPKWKSSKLLTVVKSPENPLNKLFWTPSCLLAPPSSACCLPLACLPVCLPSLLSPLLPAAFLASSILDVRSSLILGASQAGPHRIGMQSLQPHLLGSQSSVYLKCTILSNIHGRGSDVSSKL